MLPRRLQPHFLLLQMLLERMIDCPDLNRIRDIYAVISSQTTSILDLVPQDIVEKFASACNSILWDDVDHMRNVSCLAVYAFIAKETSYAPGTSSIASSGGAQISSIVGDLQRGTRKFFLGNKAGKTTSFTVMRVVYFYPVDREISTAEALEGLVLCTRLVDAIDSMIVVQWAKQKENQLILKKLEGKLLTDKVERKTKIAVSVLNPVEAATFLRTALRIDAC